MSNARDKANIPALNFSSTGIDDNATSTAITIDSSENVGIGATSPNEKLEVLNGAVQIRSSSASGYPNLKFLNASKRYDVQIDGSTQGFRIVDGTSSTERMRIDTSGNVGIGTSSPTYKLDVEDSSAGFIKGSFVSTGSNHSSISFDNTGSSADSVRIGSNNNDFYVRTNASERMRITSAGLVGIGTSSPSHELEIHSASPTIELSDSDNNYRSHITQSGSAFYFDADADAGGSSSMRFRINGGTEAMRIDSSGNVVIGTTAPTHKLQVAGDFSGTSTGTALFQNTHSTVAAGDEVMRIQFSGTGDATGGHFVNFYDSVGDIGRINVASTSTTQYATTSDYRLKENIKDVENAIDKLKLLKPRNFNFKRTPDISLDGFIAHELQEVVPLAVDGVKDQMRTVQDANGNDVEQIYPQAVDASKLIPILTKVCQEQQTKIEELEARITTLEANNP